MFTLHTALPCPILYRTGSWRCRDGARPDMDGTGDGDGDRGGRPKGGGHWRGTYQVLPLLRQEGHQVFVPGVDHLPRLPDSPANRDGSNEENQQQDACKVPKREQVKWRQ